MLTTPNFKGTQSLLGNLIVKKSNLPYHSNLNGNYIIIQSNPNPNFLIRLSQTLSPTGILKDIERVFN